MSETKKRVGPLTFFAQVRSEARKVTWTSRKETVAATVMVLVMVVVAAVFFFITDQLVRLAVQFITQVGSI